MTAVELDPLFVRALKLLQSRNKDAADQLKQMHDEVIAQRKLGFQEKKIDELKEISRGGDRVTHKKDSDYSKFGEAEKRLLESLKHEATEREKKKLKPDVQHPKTSDTYRGWDTEPDSYRQREEKSKDRTKIKSGKGRESDREEKVIKKEEVVRKVVAVISSDSDDDDDDDSDTEEDCPSPSKNDLKLDTEEFGLNMDDIVCMVCKQFNVTAVNQLVECQECHKLYHQECHRPPVTSKNVSDPRFVWYCSKCSKNLKKMVTKQPLKTKPAPLPFARDPVQASKTKLDHSMQQAFRRVDPTKTSLLKESATAARPKGLQGMASLAANLSGKHDAMKHPKAESKFLVSTAKADIPSKTSLIKSDVSKFNTSAFSRLDAPKIPSTFSVLKPDATKLRSAEGSKVVKSSSASSSSATGRMSQSSLMSADKRLSMMKKKAEKKMNDRKSSLK